MHGNGLSAKTTQTATGQTGAASPAPNALQVKKQNLSCSNILPNTSRMRQSCSHYNAICSNQRCHNNIELHTLETRKHTQNTLKSLLPCGSQKKVETTQPATASHRSCPSSQAPDTLHNNVSLSGILPKHESTLP